MALRHLTYYGQAGITDQIEQNVIWFMRDELLKIGAYFNIASGFLGYNGEDLSLLRPSFQIEHGNFQFWTGLSHQWVWESGLDTSTAAIDAVPIVVSGVYVGTTFYPTATTTGDFAHYIDYNRGGVVFTGSNVASGSVILCERTERAAFIYSTYADEYRKLTQDHLRVLSTTPGSGLDNYSPENRAMLPAIFVGVIKGNSVPYELGAIINFTSYKVNFDIFAEHVGDLTKLRDACHGLEGSALTMFDVDLASAPSGNYPLDFLGRLRDEARLISQLVTLFPFKTGRFLNNSTDRMFSPILPLHRARVTIDFEIVT